MSMQLKVTTGPDAGRKFDIAPGQTLIVGRGEKSDTKINDPSVSRIHFELIADANCCEVKDLGSSTGTFIGHRQVESGTIGIGDSIRFGDSMLQLVAIDDEKTLTPDFIERATQIKPLGELRGTELGTYRLDEVIAKGKSGMLFKATDSAKDRIAAVKVLSPQFTSTDEQRQRFVRAMKTMLPVKDGRIVRLLGAGKTGPYCWSAMEFIDGNDLQTEIENIGINGMMDWKEVWGIAVDIARALNTGFVHKIIHRNVTPKNIIRRKSDRVCLLGDFMLAKAMEGTLAQQLTSPGQILGDMPYLAPEHTKADASVDTRSDLYGLGATSYALLTGRPPVEGDTIAERIANAREKTPESPRKFQLSINEMFQDVVMKLLAKNPDHRYATPSELLRELLKIGKFNGLDPRC